MRLRFVWLGVSILSLGVAGACGGADATGDDGGTDSGTGEDATLDSAPPPQDGSTDDVVTTPDSSADDGATTTDANDGGSAQDTGVAIGIWKCGATTVTDCAQCTGYTQPCAFCGVADASAVTGVCTLINDNCVNYVPQGYQDCTCGDASQCIESYQVCTQFGRCHTCTDNGATQGGNGGLACTGGGTCHPLEGGCF